MALDLTIAVVQKSGATAGVFLLAGALCTAVLGYIFREANARDGNVGSALLTNPVLIGGAPDETEIRFLSAAILLRVEEEKDVRLVHNRGVISFQAMRDFKDEDLFEKTYGAQKSEGVDKWIGTANQIPVSNDQGAIRSR